MVEAGGCDALLSFAAGGELPADVFRPRIGSYSFRSVTAGVTDPMVAGARRRWRWDPAQARAVSAANRAWLPASAASNVFGQNAPVIAALDAED